MPNDKIRGSEKLMQAWKARTLSEASVKDIAEALDKSPAQVEGAIVSGGSAATGVRLSLRYEGEDTPRCGNDILFWLQWHRRFGGNPRPPKVIIRGTPFPDLVRLELDFGQFESVREVPGVAQALDVDLARAGDLAGAVGGLGLSRG